MIIYKITNKINGKSYIGQTIDTLHSRWMQHCRSKNKKHVLGLAINKYGKENFSVEEIASYTNLEDLNNAEEYYIEWFNMIAPNGYNLMTGGYNKRHSESTKRKQSLLQKKRFDEGRNKTSFKKGHVHSEEVQQKLKATQFKLGMKQKLVTKEKIALSKYRPIICTTTQQHFQSSKQAAKELGLHRCLISLVLRGHRKHTQGYKFIYAR